MLNKLSELEIGKAAEHLVCADLILKGYRSFLADQGLPFFGAESPYIVDVAPPLWAVQPFRVGDEGDALKIEAK